MTFRACVLGIIFSLVSIAGFAGEPVEARKHMVVAANPYASQAGLEILDAGGSAVDAAIAVQLVLTLVEPQSSGIGGGAFMLVSGLDGAGLVSYDGRETAPKSAGPDLFAGVKRTREGFLDAVAGGRSVGTPGVLAMLAHAHQKHGKLPWNRLFETAIRLSEDGFVISPRLHFLVETDPLLKRFPEARAYFFDKDGKAKPAGTVLKNPAYAAVLRKLRDEGVSAFYEGEIAKAIVEAVHTAPVNPGRLSLEDLRDYRPVERAAVCGGYRSYKVCGMAPPSSGGVTVLSQLGVLNHFTLAGKDPNDVDVVHLFAESSRLAYADREKFIADPDFVDVPVEGLLAPDYLKARATLVDPKRSMGMAPAGEPAKAPELALGETPDLPATSHFVIVDADGLAVSMTTSVENAFGSRLFVKGFFLNNQLTDFSFIAERDGVPVANRIEPGKRPRSAMSPTLVFDDKGALRIAIGSPGGPAIINFVSRALTGLIDFKLDVQKAVELPHILNSNGPTVLEAETGVAATADALRARGHDVTTRRITSGLHGIVIEGDGAERRLLGGADPRREGVALGN